MKKTTNIHFYKAMKHSHRISHLGLLKGVDNFNAKPNVDQQQSTALVNKTNKAVIIKRLNAFITKILGW
jgi:hypothetical protein